MAAWVVTSRPGGRLVGDQQRGRAGERDRDHHPLAQAAGQLERDRRRSAAPGSGICHPGEQLHARACARSARGTVAWRREHVVDLLAHGADRVERGARVLEDHRDLAPPLQLELGRARRQQVEAAEDGAPGRDPRRRVEDAHEREGRSPTCPTRSRRPRRPSRPCWTSKRHAARARARRPPRVRNSTDSSSTARSGTRSAALTCASADR